MFSFSRSLPRDVVEEVLLGWILCQYVVVVASPHPTLPWTQ